VSVALRTTADQERPCFLRVLCSSFGRGCVKTQKRPFEIVFRPDNLPVEVSGILTGRYRPQGPSKPSHAVFEGECCHGSAAELSHSLGQLRTLRRKSKSRLTSFYSEPKYSNFGVHPGLVAALEASSIDFDQGASKPETKILSDEISVRISSIQAASWPADPEAFLA